MNLQAYLKGCNRGEFQWECIDSGAYGEGSVDVEIVKLKGRNGKVKRCSKDCFEVEVDDLKFDPLYDENEFTSRKSARLWVERLIKKDIEKEDNLV